ncbi:MAG: type IV secretory system conjugative DNA transfer family protein [Brachybacterium sp.]|uniref:type IV secretory system conjugative DNA transfer family protein n=1 Tax=Brachybacterium sp. TaxID=1891286 RepID=UPI002647E640|nr:type IV secretory system conjugative DNA transfer family protein [Brachybacterium sp.]MDN5685836.1 type IV secretory system conjugative DNA transfer family protein [Brachybacterium sp.]
MLLVVLVPLALLWLAGWLVSWLSGRSYGAGPVEVLRAIVDPGRAGDVLGAGSTAGVWAVFVVLLAVAVAVGVAMWRTVRGQREAAAQEIQKERGLPERKQVRRLYGQASIMRRRKEIRPDFVPEGRRPRVGDYAFYDGKCQGVRVFTSFETPTMLLAPSRVGKTQSVIAPRVIEAPGAVLSTSTKTELVRLTWEHRETLGGPMVICDPEGVGAEAGLPGSARWCLWAGCEDVSEALARAKVLAAGGAGGVQNGEFWENVTKRVLTPLLHAAAVDSSVTMADFQKWCFDPKGATHALAILRDQDHAADLAALLESVVDMDDLETRANMWAPAANMGTALVDPQIRETFGPHGEQLDVDDFLRRSGTIYLIAQEGGNASGMVLCLVDAVWRRAVVMANSAPGGRIEPPLHLSLDEIGNIGTLPVLPRMMSEGGGLGIQTTAGFQSLAQAEQRYGAAGARALWEAATQRFVLGGVVDDSVLSAMSRIAGTRTIVQESVSAGRRGESQGRSYSEHVENVLEKHQIETMRRGLACVVEATKPLIVTELEPAFKRYARKKQQGREAEPRKGPLEPVAVRGTDETVKGEK